MHSLLVIAALVLVLGLRWLKNAKRIYKEVERAHNHDQRWPRSDSDIVHRIDGREGPMLSLAFVTAGKCIATLSRGDGGLQVWSIENGRLKTAYSSIKHDSGSALTALTASKDGEFLVTGDNQGKATIWDTTTNPGWAPRQLGAVTRKITALDISQDLTRVVCGSEDGGVVVWYIDKGDRLAGPLKNRASPVTSVKFSPTGGRIAATHYLVGRDDHSVRIWHDVAKVEASDTLPVAESTHSLAWSSDSKRLFVGGSSGSIKCFDVGTPNRSLIFEYRAPFSDHITSLHVTRNDELLISVSSGLSKMINIWDTCVISATKPIRSCSGTYIANISPDGECLATIGRDDSITIQRLSKIVGWPQSFHRVHPFTASSEPFTYISETALETWRSGGLMEVEEMLSKEIEDPRNLDISRYQRANRALVRVQQKKWAEASKDVSVLGDNQKMIITSVVKCLVLSGQGNFDRAICDFELALQSHSSDSNTRCFMECIKHIACLKFGHPGRECRETEISTDSLGDNLRRLVEAMRFSVFANDDVSRGDYSKAHDLLGKVPDLFPIFHVCEVRTVCLIFDWNLHDLIADIHTLRCRALFQLRCPPANFGYFSKRLGDLGEECTALTEVLSLRSEEFGVKAMSQQRHEEAIAWYTEALSLAWRPSDPVNGSTSTIPQIRNSSFQLGNTEVSAKIQALLSRRASLYAKRSQGKAARKSWEDARKDADQAIQTDPSNLLGYQGKYTALFGMKSYDEACVTLGEMSPKIRSYDDPEINAFMSHCALELESIGDEASITGRNNEAVKTYSAILSFCPASNMENVLVKWASTVLTCGSVEDALTAALEFRLPKFDISRTICEIWESKGHFTEAVQCFKQIKDDTREDNEAYERQSQWRSEFECRCRDKLEKLSDAAMQSEEYQEAAVHLTVLLSLNPVDRMGILIKRGKARVFTGSWDEALSDADEVIKIDPLNHRGHDIKRAVLHRIGRHREADEAFDTLLSVLDRSADPDVRELRYHYTCAKHAIRRIVDDTIRHIPLVLIDTNLGRLCDKLQQADAFEKGPIYNDLLSSMDVKPDEAQIRKEVESFYRYAMFSHRWGDREPSYQEVRETAVDQLQASSGNTKLKQFRSLACDLGFRWAWSDTCCIDKSDKAVLERSLVAMFRWYRGSSLTIVYLQDVPSKPHVAGSLRESIWNSRAWTYQEYVAAEIIQFYSKDWTPYFGLTRLDHEKSPSNHKKMPCIISEMEEATKMVLRPGLDMVREKLYLASKRKSTLEEDSAYSLFGIFKVYDMQVKYGEGNCAVGRFLGQVLTGSGDVTVLAWTGSSGEYNSCLPKDLTFYDTRKPPHIPLPIGDIDSIVAVLRSSLDLPSVMEIYKKLHDLPSPTVAAGRLKLSGLSFPITQLEPISATGSHRRKYRATTSMFGDVEIETAEDLLGMNGLFVFHPWIHHLLNEEHSKRMDETTRALRLIALLRQEFGAFLFIQDSHRQYRRVAADGLIMTRIREAVSLTELKDGICTVDIL